MSRLLSSLVEFRNNQSRLEGVEDYRVLQYKTLQEIAQKLPGTFAELSEIKGIGPAKLAKYGKRILEIVHEYTDDGGSTVAEIPNDNPPAGGQISNKIQSPKSKRESFGLDAVFGLNANTAGIGESSTLTAKRRLPSPPLVPRPRARGRVARGGEGRLGREMEGNQKQTVTVGEYLDYLNLVFQKTADVKIVGEISGFKEYPSGVYFSLKDKQDEAVLGCFLPVYTYRGLGIPLQDGLEIAVEGMPRLVKRNGRFQFTVENVELVGEGALKKIYEVLKIKLESEGLFARKRELPEFISSVGIITSRAGAVIHDFRNNLASLGIKLYLKDVRVEGAASSGMIIEAISFFNHNQFIDVLVIMRGGGSLEDLQAFNSEKMARAVFASKIPTIVSIGHDKDVPLAQLAADVMVSTPTAAAHAVNNSWGRLQLRLPRLGQELVYNYSTALKEAANEASVKARRLLSWWDKLEDRFNNLKNFLRQQTENYLLTINQTHLFLDNDEKILFGRQAAALENFSQRLLSAQGLLTQANPERQLRLGYSIVRSLRGEIIKSVAQVFKEESLETQIQDGKIYSTVKNVEKKFEE